MILKHCITGGFPEVHHLFSLCLLGQVCSNMLTPIERFLSHWSLAFEAVYSRWTDGAPRATNQIPKKGRIPLAAWKQLRSDDLLATPGARCGSASARDVRCSSEETIVRDIVSEIHNELYVRALLFSFLLLWLSFLVTTLIPVRIAFSSSWSYVLPRVPRAIDIHRYTECLFPVILDNPVKRGNHQRLFISLFRQNKISLFFFFFYFPCFSSFGLTRTLAPMPCDGTYNQPTW